MMNIIFVSAEEGQEGFTQILMTEVMKLREHTKAKTLQNAELSRKTLTLEDERKKLSLANQELQAFQQSKTKVWITPLFPDLHRLSTFCFSSKFYYLKPEIHERPIKLFPAKTANCEKAFFLFVLFHILGYNTVNFNKDF